MLHFKYSEMPRMLPMLLCWPSLHFYSVLKCRDRPFHQLGPFWTNRPLVLAASFSLLMYHLGRQITLICVHFNHLEFCLLTLHYNTFAYNVSMRATYMYAQPFYKWGGGRLWSIMLHWLTEETIKSVQKNISILKQNGAFCIILHESALCKKC